MNRVYTYVFLTAFLFATMEVSLKLAGSNLDAFQLTFLRFFIGGLILLPFARAEMKHKNIRLTGKDLAYLLLLGTTCIPVSMLLFQLGVLYCNASTASVLISVSPIFTVFFAHFIGGERLTKGKGFALIVATIGIVSMIRPWDIQEGNTVKGFILLISAAFFFGLYTVMAKKSIAKVGLMTQGGISFVLGSLVLLLIMLYMGKPVVAGVVDNFLAVMYISVFITGLGYFSYFMAIKNSDATTASFAFFIKPCIAPIIAVIVLGDNILWNTYLGIGLILMGSYLNIQEKRRLESEKSKS